MSLILYGNERSSSASVESLLAELGVPYELRNVELSQGEQLNAEYKALNPTGKLPALVFPDGQVVTESAAILLTIVDRYGTPDVMPAAGSADRARVYQCLVYLVSEVYPMIEIVDYPERFADGEAAAKALWTKARDRIRDRWLTVESRIGGSNSYLAAGFSVADIYIANLSRWSTGKEWREENCPKIEAIHDAVSRRPRIAPVWTRHFGPAAGA